jgi:predicted nucleic acid-binding protein
VPIVVDASAVVAAVFEEPDGVELTVLARDGWIVPALWWFEVRNSFIISERRQRSSEQLTSGFLRALLQITTEADTEPDSDAVLGLARKHRLTVYDAAYLELALRRGLALATLDAPLAAAARAEGVKLIGDGG